MQTTTIVTKGIEEDRVWKICPECGWKVKTFLLHCYNRTSECNRKTGKYNKLRTIPKEKYEELQIKEEEY